MPTARHLGVIIREHATIGFDDIDIHVHVGTTTMWVVVPGVRTTRTAPMIVMMIAGAGAMIARAGAVIVVVGECRLQSQRNRKTA
jgi:hypothetical protein